MTGLNRRAAHIARAVTNMLAALILLTAALAFLATFSPARASETITYTYDALGRLVTVNHGATGPNAGVSSTYSYDAADNRTQVVVTGSTATITLSPTSVPNGTVGTAYSQTISASGGTSPYTYAVSSGTLPAGLTLSSGGVLSGTPTTAATSTFAITATDSASNTGTQSYTVTINSSVTITLSPTTLSNATVGTSYSQTISASGGTSPYTFAKSAGTLPTGLTLSSGGLLSGTPTTAATYSFTVKATDSASHTGTRSYSVTVSPSNTLTLSPTSVPNGTVGTAYTSTTITASGGTSPYTFTKSAGTLPAGLTLSSGGVLSGTPTTAATYSFTVKATDSTGNHIGTRSYSVTVSPSNTLTLSPTSLPNGTVGTAYTSTTITTSGGTSPYTYAISSGALPAGLTLSSGGVLSGTPTTAATYSFTVKATDSTGNHIGTRAYSVTIAAGVTITLSPTTLANGTVGTAYSQTITASGGTSPYIFSKTSGTLPTGLTLTSGGVLSGNPSAAGTYTFNVTATDSASHTGSNSYTVTIGSGGGTNHPPVAMNDSVSLVCNTGQTFNLTANDSDPDGDPLTITSATSNGGFTVTIETASTVLISGVQTAGSYTGSYIISDGRGGSSTAAIFVTVTHGGPGGC